MTRFVEYTGGGVEDFLATQENKDCCASSPAAVWTTVNQP
jgi:hypothetical protein